MPKVKQWKNGGEHDKFILKLIKQGKVNKFTKPATLQTSYPQMFGDFSSNVVRNHLNILKRSNGLFLSGESDEDEEDNPDYIPDQPTLKISENSGDASVNENFEDSMNSGFAQISHKNYPVLCETFKDPDTLNEKVILIICLPSGAQDAKIELSEDGSIAMVNYTWSKTLYVMEDLFKGFLNATPLNIHHPKIVSLKTGLAKTRKRIDALPDSLIRINLPIRVQTSVESWTHTGVKREDGTRAIIAEFEGFVKEYNKKIIDSRVVFNM